VLLLAVTELMGQQSFGTVQGIVSEDPSTRAIEGVLVEFMNIDLRTISNEKGEYKFLRIPVGNYQIKFSVAGFGTIVETDIVVNSNRITFLNVKMKALLPHLKETVTVRASYFQKNLDVPTSNINISAEEIRRTPGASGFIGRMLTSLPGVGFSGKDENTDLLIRGGSPTENGFYIDNIEVPYISHLPRLGSSGGVFSAIHSDLVESVDFYSGGFSAKYGGRLSSITDINFRDGNKDEFDGQVDINFLMTGALLEGPIKKGKGSWLISVRKSYIKLLNEMKILDVGKPLDTQDIMVKLTYNLSPKQKINLLNFTTDGNFQDIYDNNTVEDNYYTQNTIGINWESDWSDSFISNTSLSYSFLNRKDREAFLVNSRDFHWEAKDNAKYYILKNSNLIHFANQNRLEFGFEIKHERDHINYYSTEYYTSTGEYRPPRDLIFDYNTTKTALFISSTWNIFNRIANTFGLRGDYSSRHKVFHLSPRFALSLRLNHSLAINGSYGIFYQTIPMRFVTIYPQHIDLADLEATHYTLGLEYLNQGTKVTLEAYSKDYQNLLIDPRYPIFLASELAIDSYYYPSSLTNTSKGNARGIELMIHKKLVNHFFGIFSASLFRSRYTDLDGIWRRSSYENRYLVNLIAGYKPNPKWEFGIRWVLIGGRPHTPFDLDLCRQYDTLVYDQDISKFRSLNYPAYNKLNVRAERRFYFRTTNLIVYLDIWNIFNRKNFFEYTWNPYYDRVEPVEEQLPILPILGIKYEF
jgi:hypothetical protein